MKHLIFITLLIFTTSSFGQESKGEKLFKEYCWGCHHQKSMAFDHHFKRLQTKEMTVKSSHKLLILQTLINS